MCCDRCHHEIIPGTERPAWIESLKRVGRVCAVCAAFLLSSLGQPTPQQRPAPIFYVSPTASMNINVTATALPPVSLDGERKS